MTYTNDTESFIKRFQQAVPPEMAQEKRWVAVMLMTDESGKVRKIPINALTLHGASVSMPGTWCTMNTALSVYGQPASVAKLHGQVNGIGFVLGDGWAGVDLDGGVGHGKDSIPEKMLCDFIDLNTYFEISQSGEGFHFIGKYSGKELPQSSFGHCEIYTQNQYFMITGDCPAFFEANDITEKLIELHKKYILKPLQELGLNTVPHEMKVHSMDKPNQLSDDEKSRFFHANILEMLEHIPADCSRVEWIKVGTVLKSEGVDFSVFDRWSSTAPHKYNARDTASAWRSFRQTALNGGYIVRLALNNGWKPTKKTESYNRILHKTRTAKEETEMNQPEMGPTESSTENAACCAQSPPPAPNSTAEPEAANFPHCLMQSGHEQGNRNDFQIQYARETTATAPSGHSVTYTQEDTFSNGQNYAQGTPFVIGSAAPSFPFRNGLTVLEDTLRDSRTNTMVASGISRLDKHLGGGFLPGLVVVSGAPSEGKSALAIQLATYLAKNEHKSVLFYSFEMPASQLVARVFSYLSFNTNNKVTAKDILTGSTPPDAMKALTDDFKTFGSLLHFYDEPAPNITETIALAEKYISSTGTVPILIIDYLQLYNVRHGLSTADGFKDITLALKQFAIRHNTVVIAISSVNRNAQSSGLSIGSAYGSGFIEYSADYLLSLEFTASYVARQLSNPAACEAAQKAFRCMLDEFKAQDERYMSLTLQKARMNPCGISIPLVFHTAFNRFEEITENLENQVYNYYKDSFATQKFFLMAKPPFHPTVQKNSKRR